MCYNLYIIIITPRLDSLGVYIIDITSINDKYNALNKYYKISITQVATEKESHKPGTSGIYLFGNINSSKQCFSLVSLSNTSTYTVTSSGLGTFDSDYGNTKHLYRVNFILPA